MCKRSSVRPSTVNGIRPVSAGAALPQIGNPYSQVLRPEEAVVGSQAAPRGRSDADFRLQLRSRQSRDESDSVERPRSEGSKSKSFSPAIAASDALLTRLSKLTEKAQARHSALLN